MAVLYTIYYSLFLHVKLSSLVHKYLFTNLNVVRVWLRIEGPPTRWALFHILLTASILELISFSQHGCSTVLAFTSAHT
jgi:hypothetical protein